MNRIKVYVEFCIMFVSDLNLISKFALLENKHGFKEHAVTLFENMLITYPGRVDVWSVYVDMLVKSGNIDQAR